MPGGVARAVLEAVDGFRHELEQRRAIDATLVSPRLQHGRGRRRQPARRRVARRRLADVVDQVDHQRRAVPPEEVVGHLGPVQDGPDALQQRAPLAARQVQLPAPQVASLDDHVVAVHVEKRSLVQRRRVRADDSFHRIARILGEGHVVVGEKGDRAREVLGGRVAAVGIALAVAIDQAQEQVTEQRAQHRRRRRGQHDLDAGEPIQIRPLFERRAARGTDRCGHTRAQEARLADEAAADAVVIGGCIQEQRRQDRHQIPPRRAPAARLGETRRIQIRGLEPEAGGNRPPPAIEAAPARILRPA